MLIQISTKYCLNNSNTATLLALTTTQQRRWRWNNNAIIIIVQIRNNKRFGGIDNVDDNGSHRPRTRVAIFG